MTHIKSFTSRELAERLGFAEHLDLIQTTMPTRWGIARLIRREVRRQGLVTRRELRKVIEPYLNASGFFNEASHLIREVADEMVTVGEIADLRVENQRGYAALPSRWIPLGDNVAILLGTTATEKHRFYAYHPNQFLRRFRPKHAMLQDLDRAGISCEPFITWFGEPGWARFCAPGDCIESLDSLLDRHITDLEREGAPFSPDDTSIRIVNFSPGDFFGQPWEQTRSRWITPKQVADGIYIGAQPGYSERQWHPLLVKIQRDVCKSQVIHFNNNVADSFELRNWLLLALSSRNRLRERVIVDHINSELQLTFPAPKQLIRCLKLAGESDNAWRYSVLNSRPLVDLLSGVFAEIDFASIEN